MLKDRGEDFDKIGMIPAVGFTRHSLTGVLMNLPTGRIIAFRTPIPLAAVWKLKITTLQCQAAAHTRSLPSPRRMIAGPVTQDLCDRAGCPAQYLAPERRQRERLSLSAAGGFRP